MVRFILGVRVKIRVRGDDRVRVNLLYVTQIMTRTGPYNACNGCCSHIDRVVESTRGTFPVQTGGIVYFSWHIHQIEGTDGF